MCHQCRCTKPPEKEKLLNIWEDKAKAYIVRQDEEAFLEPLNISVDKKTQERDRADISLGWYFAIYSDVWIGGIGGGPGSARPPRVHQFCTGKKVIYDWRQQIKWNYRCTVGKKPPTMCCTWELGANTLPKKKSYWWKFIETWNL